MAMAVLTMDLVERHLIVIESGQEKVWPIDDLPFSPNWHKLPASCQQKILNYVDYQQNENSISQH